MGKFVDIATRAGRYCNVEFPAISNTVFVGRRRIGIRCTWMRRKATPRLLNQNTPRVIKDNFIVIRGIKIDGPIKASDPA